MSEELLREKIHSGRYKGQIANLNEAVQEYERLFEQSRSNPYPLNQVPKLLSELCNAIEKWPQNLETLLDIRGWRFDQLVYEENGRKVFRAPRIKLTAEITSKGNLAIKWLPKGRRYTKYVEEKLVKFNETDFWMHHIELNDKSLWQPKAPSEIVFVRNIEAIDALIDDGNTKLVAHLHYCITSIFESVENFLNDHFEVDQRNDFELLLDAEGEVSGWRLFNIKERQKQKLAEWLDGFSLEYGIEPKAFVDCFTEDKGRGPFEAGKVKHRGEAKKVIIKLEEASNELAQYATNKRNEEKSKQDERSTKEKATSDLKISQRTRNDWEIISSDELNALVWMDATTNLARHFGVSDNAINKKCRKFDIKKPPRGFWAKVYAGKLPHPNGKPQAE